MGGFASKVFGRGYRSTEPGTPNVPADADGAHVEAGRQAAAHHAAATEDASSKHQAKPEAASQGKGTTEETKVPGSPTKAKAEPPTPTSDAAKPTALDAAKEEALGVLESVKKSVGAAKEAFFEKTSKTETSPTKPTAEQAEPTKTPEAKTPEAKGGSFLTKLGITKSEEANQKAKEEATSKELSKPTAEIAQGQAEPSGEKAKIMAPTPPSVTGAGTATAEAGKGTTVGGAETDKLKIQELASAGKVAAEGMKQKSQEACEAAKQATDAALHKAGELKDAAAKAASAEKEKVASLADQAQKSMAAAADAAEKKGEEAAQKAKAEAHTISQKSHEAASAAKAKAQELEESAVAAGKDAAAAAAAKVEAAKKTSQEAVTSAADKVSSATEKAKEVLKSEAAKVEPVLKQASESAKEKAREAADTLKSGASAVLEASKSAAESAAKAVPELIKDATKEKTESPQQQDKQQEPVAASSPSERKSSEAVAEGKDQSESAGKNVKPSPPEEPRRSEAKPLDAAPKEHMVYTAILDVNAAAGGESALSAKTVAMKSDAKVGDGARELYFKPVEDALQETAESSPKAVSQEVLDSAKSEAELLVERVISSVVGASESLKHSADDSVHGEKDRFEKLKEKAQQEFALCQEKAQHLLSDVTTAVSTAASSVAAKSAEMYDATKSKAHDFSEQVTAKASDTAESLKHGMHTLQEQAMELPHLILHKSHDPSGGETTTDSSVSEVSHEQAPLLQADNQRETPRDRLSPSPKPEDIESAIVKIQAGVRGYLTRKNLQIRTQQDGETAHTTENSNQEEQVVASSGSEPSDTEAAATKIQAAFRGYMVRKELKPDNGPGSGALHKEELVESR